MAYDGCFELGSRDIRPVVVAPRYRDCVYADLHQLRKRIMTGFLCKCGCKRAVERRSYETDNQWRKREAKGLYRDKCAKNLPAPARSERVRPSLSLISRNVGMVETVAQEKPHRFASIPYRRFVASLRCCHCGKAGCEPHHHQEPGEGCTGGKVGDEKCVPLCGKAHRDIHQYGRSVWQHWGVDPVQVIAAVQEAWWKKHGTRPWLNGI